MPANIGRMMYVGEKPWHGAGTRLDKVVDSKQAIKSAGLDWNVVKTPLYLSNGTELKKYFATARADTQDVLGVVGKVYHPLQNKEAFSFFDAVVGLKEAIYETAGYFGKGEVIWILAKLKGVVRVLKDDITDKYLLLTNRHDGFGAVVMMFTPIRVVCQNTLNMALRGTESKVKMRHTINIGDNVLSAQDQLGIINQRYELFQQASEVLAKKQVKQSPIDQYLRKLGLIPPVNAKPNVMAERKRDTIYELIERGRGTDIKGVRGSMWGTFNAVAEYVDYNYRGRGDEQESLRRRGKHILFGQGHALKQRAFDLALSMSK